MEINQTAGHRAFRDPTRHEMPTVRTPWRLYGNCTTPISINPKKHTDIERFVRCRRCPGCIRARRHLWRLRAEFEFFRHGTNWFFTGTYANQTSDFDVVSKDITDWLKRVRYYAGSGLPKEQRLPIRYIVAVEPHLSGKLHMHSLLHTNGRLRYRDLKRAWKKGFIDASIASPSSAGYVTKYVTKSLVTPDRVLVPRVRASRGYGVEVMERDMVEVQRILAERNNDVCQTWETNLKHLIKEIQKPPTMRDLIQKTSDLPTEKEK